MINGIIWAITTVLEENNYEIVPHHYALQDQWCEADSAIVAVLNVYRGITKLADILVYNGYCSYHSEIAYRYETIEFHYCDPEFMDKLLDYFVGDATTANDIMRALKILP